MRTSTSQSEAQVRTGRGLLLAVPLAFLGVFFVYPVASIIGRGLTPGGTLDLSPLGAVVTDPHLRDAPREKVLLGHERRTVREPAAGELEADIAGVVPHARPCPAGGANGNDGVVQPHVDGHVPQRHVPGVW